MKKYAQPILIIIPLLLSLVVVYFYKHPDQANHLGFRYDWFEREWQALNAKELWQFYVPLASISLIFYALLGFLSMINSTVTKNITNILIAFATGVSSYLAPVLFANESLPLTLLTIAIINGFHLFGLMGHAKIKASYKLLLLKFALPFMVAFLSQSIIVNRHIGTKDVMIEQQTIAYINDQNPIQNPRLYSDTNIKIAVFTSLECPACKTLAKDLSIVKSYFGDRISIEQIHFPLSSACNPYVSSNTQPNSCAYALAVIAAENQLKGEAVQDFILKNEPFKDINQFNQMAQSVGLNLEQWKRDMQDEETKQKLASDLVLAKECQISATPTTIINGVKAPNNRLNTLTYIINYFEREKTPGR